MKADFPALFALAPSSLRREITLEDVQSGFPCGGLDLPEWNELTYRLSVLYRELTNLRVAAGHAANDSDLTQIVQAVSRGVFLGSFGGTANALTASLPNGVSIPALVRGMRFTGSVSAPNTGPVTMTMGGFGQAPGTLALMRRDGQPLAAGDLVAERDFEFRFDGTAFRTTGPVVSEINTVINTYIVARPPVQQVYVDETNGDDGNDGLSTGKPKKSLDNAIEAAAGTSTRFLLLSDCQSKQRHTVYVPHLVVGIQAANNPAGYIQFKRTLRWLGTATNSPRSDGSTCCAGIFENSATIRFDYVDFVVPDVPAGQTYTALITSLIELAVFIYNANVNVVSASAGYVFEVANAHLSATLTLALGTGAAGHLFRGVAAGADPNAQYSYETNVTSA